MHQPVSVCHQWSITGFFSSRSAHWMVSGSARSPARNSVRNFDRSYLANSLPSRVFLLDGAERGRRGEHGDAPVLGDDAPERAGVGRADRLALVEDRGRAVQQRRIDDVAVADHPADVGAAHQRLAGLDAVEILHRPFQRDHVAAVVAHHALRDAGGARGVEDVERIGGEHRHAARARSSPRPAPRPRSSASRGRGRASARTAACGRCRIRQASGLCLARSIASSSSGL